MLIQYTFVRGHYVCLPLVVATQPFPKLLWAILLGLWLYRMCYAAVTVQCLAASRSTHEAEAATSQQMSPFIHCKNIRICTDILWRVFQILTEPITYTFVSVSLLNNKAQTLMALHYSVCLWMQTYTEAVKLKFKKLATKCPWCTDIFTVSAVHLVVEIRHLLNPSDSGRQPLMLS